MSTLIRGSRFGSSACAARSRRRTPTRRPAAAGDTRIILDAGSGLRTLGDERMAGGPRHSTILLSHLHWDHVCGLPFFTPIYVPEQRVEIASGPNGVMPTQDAIRSLFKARRHLVPRAIAALRSPTTRSPRAGPRSRTPPPCRAPALG